MAKATRAVTSLFAPAEHSPEYDLLTGPMRDARLVPRVPMSNADIDVGLLTQLSSIGLKRAKQVTDQSHPELMQVWKTMAHRAGLAKAPQLIIAESPSLNALTVNKDEVTITTGLLRILDLRETAAVLGHELGHVQSDHVGPRTMWMGGLSMLGAFAGNEFGRKGGANTLMHAVGGKVPLVETLRGWFYPKAYTNKASSMLGYMAYMGAGVAVGSTAGKHMSVHPTELDADAKGAAISGDPEGLAAALAALQQHSPRTSFMTKVAQMRSGYPSTEKRIEHLRRLAGQQQDVPVVAQPSMQLVQPMMITAEHPTVAVSDIAGSERVAAAIGPALN